MVSDEDDYGWFLTLAQNDPSLLEAACNVRLSSNEEPCRDSAASSWGGGQASCPGRLIQPDLVTRSFLSQDAMQVWTWGVGGLRIVRGRHGMAHAEFQIVACADGRHWEVWKRINSVAKLARRGRESGPWSLTAQLAWERLHGAATGHCNWRDEQYLRHVCVLMHEFLRQYLFVCGDLDSLVSFVSGRSRQCVDRGQAVSPPLSHGS